MVNTCSGNVHNTNARSELGYKGLSWSGKMVTAEIRKDKKRYKLGIHFDVKIAAYAYNCAALQLYGDLAKLNDIEKPDGFKWDAEKMRLVEI